MKSGIDYFPLDVHIDDKLELIEAEFGLTGFGVVVKLLQEIYGKQGYYIEWTTEVALLFSKKIGLGGGVVSEILEASIRRGMFDKTIYDKYGILTSRGIQKRYFEAVSRRKEIEVDKRILLVEVALICRNVNISWKNADISVENADIPEQSRAEESIEEDSIFNDDYDDARTREQIELKTTPGTLFQRYFGRKPTEDEWDMCHTFMCMCDPEVLENAFFRASNTDNKNLAYVGGILENYRKRGVESINDVADDDIRFERQRQTKAFKRGGRS